MFKPGWLGAQGSRLGCVKSSFTLDRLPFICLWGISPCAPIVCGLFVRTESMYVIRVEPRKLTSSAGAFCSFVFLSLLVFFIIPLTFMRRTGPARLAHASDNSDPTRYSISFEAFAGTRIFSHSNSIGTSSITFKQIFPDCSI